MPAMLIRLIPQFLFMAAFAQSLLPILDPNNISDHSLGFGLELGLELGLGLGLGVGRGSQSWWNQSWFYNPL